MGSTLPLDAFGRLFLPTLTIRCKQSQNKQENVQPGDDFEPFVMTTPPNTSNPSGGAFLYFWKIYWHDSANGHLPLSKLNQNSLRMQRIRPGDVVWAFTRRKMTGLMSSSRHS